MSHVKVYCRLTSPIVRNMKIEPIDLSARVEDLRQIIAARLSLSVHEIGLIYCGIVLKEENLLSVYKVVEGCSILVFKKINRQPVSAEPLDFIVANQIIREFRQLLKMSATRTALERIWADQSMLHRMVVAVPSMASDLVAIAMFQDKDFIMLTRVLGKDVVNRALSLHPSLADAVKFLVNAVNDDIAGNASNSKPNAASASRSRVQYGLDEMSDEEEDDDVDLAGVVPAGQAGALIDTSAGGGGQITADFFRQAMQMVYARENQPSSVQSPPEVVAATQPLITEVTEAQIQHLRDMGITDDNLVRRALEASGGNLEAAIEFIFGDGM